MKASHVCLLVFFPLLRQNADDSKVEERPIQEVERTWIPERLHGGQLSHQPEHPELLLPKLQMTGHCS